MSFEVRHADFHRLVHPEAAFERVATGFNFVEGPIWHPMERTIIFSDILGNTLYRWHIVDGLTKLRLNSHMANGNAYDHQGRVVTCEHATSRITRTDFKNSDEREILATHYDGRQLNSPNDVVVKRDGMIYFTDPTSGRSEKYGVPREPELPFSGVYRLDPQIKALTLLIDDFAKPNGLCFSADEKQLFVNDTIRQHIRVFDVLEDSSLGRGRLFAELTGNEPGVADGMKIDQEGNVYCCGPGGIHIFKKNGDCLGIIKTPESAANFVFGDDDLRSLYITARTSLYHLRVNVPGLKTYDPGTP